MTSFDDYWDRLCKLTPDLRDSAKMTMTPKAFKKALRNAFLANSGGADAAHTTKKSVSASGPISALTKLVDVFFNGREAK